MQAVRAAAKLTAPTLDELPLMIEDDHAVRFLAGGIYGVVNVNVSLRVFANAMRVPVLNIGGELAPVMRDLVGVFSGTKDRLLAAGLVCSTKDQRCDEGGSELSEKSTAGYGHLSPSSVSRLQKRSCTD